MGHVGLASAPSDGRRISVDPLRLMLEKAESLGLSSTSLLRRCKLSYSLDDLRSGRISQLRVPEFSRAQEACMLEIRRRIAPDHYAGMSREDFDFMCHALITSTTLREMLDRQSRFFEIGGRRDGWSHLSDDYRQAMFQIGLGPVETRWEFFFTVNAFCVFSRLSEWMIGEPIDAEFETSCPASADNVAIAQILGVPLRFGAAANRILFDRPLLGRPIVRPPAELRDFLLSFPFDVTAPARTDASLAARVSAVYREALLNHRPLPTLQTLSARMGIANATLRRRLEAEGTSVRAIKERVREVLARDYLCGGLSPVGQVAATLGYSSPKAFTRAFRGWTGATPASFRDAQHGDL